MSHDLEKSFMVHVLPSTFTAENEVQDLVAMHSLGTPKHVFELPQS